MKRTAEIPVGSLDAQTVSKKRLQRTGSPGSAAFSTVARAEVPLHSVPASYSAGNQLLNSLHQMRQFRAAAQSAQQRGPNTQNTQSCTTRYHSPHTHVAISGHFAHNGSSATVDLPLQPPTETTGARAASNTYTSNQQTISSSGCCPPRIGGSKRSREEA
jgi:hypothetical protein